jgi:predicted AAA+ superfamily ATPase
MASIFKKFKHALSRLLGGPSGAEKKQRQTLLRQEEESRQKAEARREALINLRRAIAAGRSSLLAWEDDTIGG